MAHNAEPYLPSVIGVSPSSGYAHRCCVIHYCFGRNDRSKVLLETERRAQWPPKMCLGAVVLYRRNDFGRTRPT